MYSQLTGLNGTIYTLKAKPFGSGGEGNIYEIANDSTKVVKVYHSGRVSEELQDKLMYMTKNPPSQNILDQVAWPLDIVCDSTNEFKGFVMPKIDIDAELGDIYVYPSSNPKMKISYKSKLIIAMNICSVIKEVHDAGYVFGDFNPRNIGINIRTGKVAFLDTDSYHIVLDEKNNKAYRCKVCLDGYVAPELLKQCEPYKKDAYENAPLPTFTKETDGFALAIHIFKLLMNGYTPFNGIKEDETVSTASPGVGNQAIKRDSYCFKKGNKPQAVAVPSADILPKDIKKLFDRAFIDSRSNPKMRPDAGEWYKALSSYENSLVECPNNSLHMYRKGLKPCPWCQADERYEESINRPMINRNILPSNNSNKPPVYAPSNQVVPAGVYSGAKNKVEAVASILLPVSWLLFMTNLLFCMVPVMIGRYEGYGSFVGNIRYYVICIITSIITEALVCFATNLKDAGLFSIIASHIWNFVVCFSAATMRYEGMGYSAVSASSTWKFFGIILAVSITTLVISAKLGTVVRNKASSNAVSKPVSSNTKTKPKMNAFDIIFTLLMIGIDVFGIYLLIDFDKFYLYLNNYMAFNIGIWVAPALLFIIFSFTWKDNEIVRSWFCVTMTLLFDFLVLRLGVMNGATALILWLVLAIIAILFIIYIESEVVSFVSTIALFVIFILGAFIDLKMLGNGPGVVGEAGRMGMVIPVVVTAVVALIVSVHKLVKG